MCSDFTFKKCTECKVEKSLDAFAKKGHKSNGNLKYESKCKECRKKYDNRRYEKKSRAKKKIARLSKTQKEFRYEVVSDCVYRENSKELVQKWLNKLGL